MRFVPLSPLVLAFTLLACHEPFSNEDLLFLKSLPRRDTLRFAVPSDESSGRGLAAAQSSASAGGPAQFYLEARGAAEGVNEGVFEPLVLVERLTAEPPSLREEDRRIWGPFFDHGLAYSLVVERKHTETGTVVAFTSTSTRATVQDLFDYGLLVRLEDAPESQAAPLFMGRFAPVEDIDSGMGQLFLNLELARALNPDAKDGGALFVGYDTRHQQITVELIADTIVGGELFSEPEGFYHYELDGAGAGLLVFGVSKDEFGSPLKEILWIAARWLADGRGRADVALTGGDVAADPLWASECWDERFRRTYLLSNVPEVEPVGSIVGCAPSLRAPELVE